ncbi:HEAT repeat domain-containing protein [Rhodocyclus tenuis]|uniref:HEAT repeat domain-containing protein n=1 Tax=Rhodocyclus gracilis TaxID=2929842 RepID=A0ABX0WJS5_9RHOO|nr:HEAT repeat domain-containing protein [Rhodocyclus gracilis]NJA89967.1 HEAT repeat domain-containing protein [Rhodocyclus gracilis]
MPLIKPGQTPPSDEEKRRWPRDADGLLRALDDSTPSARRCSARDMANAENDAQRALFAAALLARLRSEHEVSVREVMLTTLVRLGDIAALSGLAECLRSDDTTLRNEVIEAMREAPAETAPIILELLGDAEPSLRVFAVNILESFRHPDVEHWLIDLISHEANVNVCASAVDVLCLTGSTASRPALLALRQRFPEEPFLQFAIDLALKRTAD